ncbi:hypothetical protein NAEGRDRAFT_80795 [Naegleria gruberi]|uniref:Uncharacterized protein n=1 Tax=Naegleria gruberi TaxID=5762 RepID=D2VPW7_NAEGR|nr:uncharacterized protein NAEGRDRAFT_80795 [Naegleria gruberi]EFC41198.1 hypothetical protein NAEGRDRAFT_80795 [Naegleria gruberi]|eukprot:XP_002673942.1 hypothetical protein NAEGRDRAFT_80795 [Naegleria gruberi strain NEG-M]
MSSIKLITVICFLCMLNVVFAQIPNNKAVMGGNLGGLADYSNNLVFIDAMRTARYWGQADAPWNTLPVDQYNQDSYPVGYSAGTVVFIQPAGTVNGTYYFQGDGQLTVDLVASSDCELVNFTYSNGKTTGYIVVGDQATQLMLGFTQPTNTSFQNIRLIRPGFTIQDADTLIFLPSFIQDIKDLKLIRMMDWCSTNANPITKWSERARSTISTFSTSKGISYETIIALANMHDKEVWVNIPAMVDEDYILQMAKLFKEKLSPNRVFYLEYSNEIWNSGFEQTDWNFNYAEYLVTVGNMTIFNYDQVNNKYTWGFRRTGYVAYRISEIFASVFGESKRNTQFRVVLAGQGANSYIVSQGLQMIEKFGAPSKYLYAIASAPYFQIDNNYSGTMSKDAVLNELEYQMNRSPAVYDYGNYICMAKFYGLKHMAYEGGPDTFGPYNIQSKRLASFEPRMKQITIDFLRNWFSYGFDAFVWYTVSYGGYDSQYGTWGWAEYISDSYKPKREGILYMVNNPNVPYNTTVFKLFAGPVNSILSTPAVKHQLADSSSSATVLASAQLDSVYYYPMINTRRGIYSVRIEAANVLNGGGYLGIYMNNVKLGSVLSNSAVYNFTIPINSGIIEKGLNVVTMVIETDRALNIRTVNVTLIQEVAEPVPTPTPIPALISTVSNNDNRTITISTSSTLTMNVMIALSALLFITLFIQL